MQQWSSSILTMPPQCVQNGKRGGTWRELNAKLILTVIDGPRVEPPLEKQNSEKPRELRGN
jgi:hypothetical protein